MFQYCVVAIARKMVVGCLLPGPVTGELDQNPGEEV